MLACLRDIISLRPLCSAKCAEDTLPLNPPEYSREAPLSFQCVRTLPINFGHPENHGAIPNEGTGGTGGMGLEERGKTWNAAPDGVSQLNFENMRFLRFGDVGLRGNNSIVEMGYEIEM